VLAVMTATPILVARKKCASNSCRHNCSVSARLPQSAHLSHTSRGEHKVATAIRCESTISRRHFGGHEGFLLTRPKSIALSPLSKPFAGRFLSRRAKKRPADAPTIDQFCRSPDSALPAGTRSPRLAVAVSRDNEFQGRNNREWHAMCFTCTS